jgi:outer membrane receptor protein involved in Fe transport
MRVLQRFRARARFLAWSAVIALLIAAVMPAHAAPETGTVSVTVSTAEGIPIAGAVVSLHGRSEQYVGRSDAQGNVKFEGVAIGTWVIGATAAGYADLTGRTIQVSTGEATIVELDLSKSASSLVVLGRVRTTAGESLSTASVPTQIIDATTAAAQGVTSVADVIAGEAISTMVNRPVSGSPAAPSVIALRGPDPTETLTELDGHSLNSGGTGAFDLSLIDPAELSDVQLVYGISPSSLVGPNTIDGAVNMQTIDPTATENGLERLSFGSFDAMGETLQATGTHDGIGYVLSLHRTTTNGEVSNDTIASDAGGNAVVGSTVDGTDELSKLRLPFDHSNGYVQLTFLGQNEYRDLSAALTSIDNPGGKSLLYDSSAGSSLQAHNLGYALDIDTPLGKSGAEGLYKTTLVARQFASVSDQSVVGPASSSTLFLYNDRDALQDDSLEVDQSLSEASTLSAKLELRDEDLDTQEFVGGAVAESTERQPLSELLGAAEGGGGPGSAPIPVNGLTQVERSAVVRYTTDTGATLHYAVATYFSDFSSFGKSVDPRFGVTWTPTAQTVVRGSVGTTFQSPQLPELYVPPVLPPPDSAGYIQIGNPNLKADRATDYDIGVEHDFGASDPVALTADVYRTDVRTPSQQYFPPHTCTTGSDAFPAGGTATPPPSTDCISFPINVGGAVYQGVEFTAEHSVAPATQLRLSYGVNSAYANSVSPDFQDGTIVVGEQFLGVPLQKGVLALARSVPLGWGYDLNVAYDGEYNENFRPPFALVNAGLTWNGSFFDFGLYGTNLTNVFDDKFTLDDVGVPYGGVNGPIPQDAYSLQGRAFTFVVTRHY